jgi:hypothetical protein
VAAADQRRELAASAVERAGTELTAASAPAPEQEARRERLEGLDAALNHQAKRAVASPRPASSRH